MGVWKQRAIMAFDIGVMLLSFAKLIFNSKDISPIFRGRSFTNHRAFQQTLASLKSDPETAELIRTRYLAPQVYDLDALASLPEGTLGREFARHMREQGLELVFYPPLEHTDDGDIAYLRRRARQTHDIHHVVLGFPANELGEMMISAFYLAQDRVPLSALLIGIGFLHGILRQPHRIDDLMTVLIHGWTMGKQARKKLMGVRWEEYWETPIAEVRAMMGVTPPWERPDFPPGALADLEPAPPMALAGS